MECKGSYKISFSRVASGRSNEKAWLHRQKEEKSSTPNPAKQRLNQRIKHGQTPSANTHIPTKTDTLDVIKQVNFEKQNVSVSSRKKGGTFNDEHVETTFQMIRTMLGNQMIGQKNYLDQLCLAFKRPFVTGIDKGKPKNTMVLFGSPGSGRRSGLSQITALLKENKLVNHGTVSIIDLASYTTSSEYQLFLSDLYKCLYGQSDVVLFENIDKCNPMCLM